MACHDVILSLHVRLKPCHRSGPYFPIPSHKLMGTVQGSAPVPPPPPPQHPRPITICIRDGWIGVSNFSSSTRNAVSLIAAFCFI